MKAMILLAAIGLAGLVAQSAVADTEKEGGMRANTNSLHRHVAFLTSVDGYRHYANLQGLQRCADYIRSEFLSANGRVSAQDFQAQNNTYQNIICSLGPAKGPRIIVGAHYDVCGPQPGADDNASAVAGLLEIARLMGARGDPLKYRLDLVAYCLEEPPFFGTSAMGSYFHARSLRKQKVSVKEMICLEMIGFFSERENSQQFPMALMKWFYPNKANFIAVVSNLRNWQLVRLVQHDMDKATDLEVCMLSAPALVPGVGLSDHSSYWKFGFPAVMITDTAFYRNPNYHMPSDTIETLDFEKMAEVVNAIVSHLVNQQSR
ncbi:MAG: M28 family peptidase [Desulfobacteraceae bacterium]|jgi:hypothetical protein